MNKRIAMRYSLAVAVASTLMLGAGTASAAITPTWECWRYVNGKPEGFVKVASQTKSGAESEALDRFRNKLKKKVDYVKCK